MEPSRPRKQYKLILIPIVCVVIFIVGLKIYQTVTFRLVGTNPSVNRVATISPFFKVEFNKNLIRQDISITSTSNVLASYSVSGSIIDILLNEPLSSSKSYSITVSNIYSTAHKHLANQKFTFTPKNVTAESLPQDQKQALNSIQQQYNRAIQGNGLVPLLPFISGGSEFRVDYTARYVDQKAHLVIVITSLTQGGYNDALSWIKAVGFNPANYDIVYVNAPA
jgi:hypothetical protein